MRGRRVAASLIALALTAGLAACTDANTGIADQYRAGDGKGFISGDGTIQTIPADKRGAAVDFSGKAADGSTLTSKDYAGKVVVLNFWYAHCGPCRGEAPLLAKEYAKVHPKGADFLGVNIYDGAAEATAFAQEYKIDYPSLLAADDAKLKLAFASWTPLQSVPITLVIDKKGRVAARFLGAIESPAVFDSVITETLAEKL